jgi:Protein of unknown function (DUF3134)
MVKFHHPSLSEEFRNAPARIILLRESESILNWLKRTNRIFKSNESDRPHEKNVPEELEDILDISIFEQEREEEEELDLGAE